MPPTNILAAAVLLSLPTTALAMRHAAVDDPTPVDRVPVIVTTLQMDPEHPREIVGWWSSPTELIHLAPDGRYRHWMGHDRFAAPIRTGRWHRENHAVFWLESYAIPKPPRNRAALWLRDDALMANIGIAAAAFEHRGTPPRIPADDLLGMWTGPGGTMEFRPDSTYVWTAPASESPLALGGQRGRWQLDADGRLRLDPLASLQSPVLTGLRRDDGASPDPIDDRIVELQSIAGPLHRSDAEHANDVVPANPPSPEVEPEPATSP